MSFYRRLLIRFHPYKTIQDEYITRMQGSMGGGGMLHRGNIYCFDYVMKHLPTQGAILEIGSFVGTSTNVITALMRKHGVVRPFFSCDPWIYDGYHDLTRRDDVAYMTYFEGCSHLTRRDYTAFIKESYIRNTRLFSPDLLPYTIEARSENFFSDWQESNLVTDVFGRQVQAGGALSFVYIDGDHSYESARMDVLTSLDHVTPGGFLLLDDSADYWQYGSVRLAKEMRKWKNIELVMKNPNYLYRKR